MRAATAPSPERSKTSSSASAARLSNLEQTSSPLASTLSKSPTPCAGSAPASQLPTPTTTISPREQSKHTLQPASWPPTSDPPPPPSPPKQPTSPQCTASS